ncbi:MAG: sulfotransferase [Phycisphaerales bacterium]|nr:MAG: sulfotransferase [Phycisphaerales bacterium]
MIRSPVFIVGSERSGTTVLRLMLDHHPKVALFFEFEFAVDLISPDGVFPSLELYHDYLSTDRVFQSAHVEVDPRLDYCNLVDSFLGQKRARDGKEVVGATVHRNFDRLPYVWPDARFIHILRDGRDVARSVVPMGWAGNAWRGAQWWIDAERMWERMRGLLEASRWIDVRYEELIGDSRGTLSRVCEFIGVDFDEAIYEYAKTSSYPLPDPTKVFQWRTKSPPRELRLLEGRIGDMLTQRGYELSGVAPAKVGRLFRRWLMLHSRLVCALFRVKRYGLPLYLADFLARRLPFTGYRKRLRLRTNAIDREHLR